MKNGFIFVCMFAVLVSACGNSSPSTSEFRAALESRLDKKGCATSHLFNDFPIKARVAQHNQDILDVFENAGLIELSEDHYVLSELGEQITMPIEEDSVLRKNTSLVTWKLRKRFQRNNSRRSWQERG